MSEVVLDASALLVMLKGERGAAKVAKAITSARICAVNFAEVVSHFARLEMPPAAIDAMLDPLPMTIVPADKALSALAGQLAPLTSSAGLSLGDRFCLALAQRDGFPVWTCDTNWNLIHDQSGVKVVLLR